MADETTTTTDTTNTTTTITEPKVTDFLDETGTFKDGWKDALVPEDLRGRKVFDAVPDLRAVLKLLAHQEKFLGSQGKGIMPLGENPTATELEMFRKSLGIPDTPEGYKVEVPEGLGDYYDEAVMKETLKGLHALHLTPKQVAGVVALEAERLRAGIKEQEQSEAAARDDTEAALKEIWGADYEKNLRLANRIIAENVSDEEKDGLLALIGNSVPVARLFAKLGEAHLEDKVVSTDVERPGSASSEIERLEATPGYANGELKRTNRKEHDRIVARLAVLYGRKFPEPQTATT